MTLKRKLRAQQKELISEALESARLQFEGLIAKIENAKNDPERKMEVNEYELRMTKCVCALAAVHARMI